ncbi:MAG: SAM-dependent methyltransferase [Acidobacteria bacterium]|nr:SAM-dependent methyltransferase [Acidobacteriota bacterium]
MNRRPNERGAGKSPPSSNGDAQASIAMSETHLDEFTGEIEQSIATRAFVKLTLGKYRGHEPGLKNIYVRLVEVKKTSQLSFLYRYQTRDVFKNHPVPEGLALIRSLIGADFLSAHLFILTADLRIEYNKKRAARLITRPPTFTEPPPVAHDQKKRRHIELDGNVYLRALGVTNEHGEVRERMGDKFRQINKFVETVSGLFVSSPLAGKRELSIVDMGSGKGYLTFAVYDFFNNVLGISAGVTGVEAREELVHLCNDIARQSGFDRLSFRTGHIEDFEVEEADILIALHACDTATDDALFKGIKARAAIIIAAPCCHKQLRPQIKPPGVLRSVLRHGHLLEREAEMITDSLRALLLEESGYKTKVFEFVSTEHTPKNTMIAGIKKSGSAGAVDARRQLEELKRFFGIEEQYLERLLSVADGK